MQSDQGLHYLPVNSIDIMDAQANVALLTFCMHYKNTPIQIYRKFHLQKLKISDKNSDIFHISAQNIDCEY